MWVQNSNRKFPNCVDAAKNRLLETIKLFQNSNSFHCVSSKQYMMLVFADRRWYSALWSPRYQLLLLSMWNWYLEAFGKNRKCGKWIATDVPNISVFFLGSKIVLKNLYLWFCVYTKMNVFQWKSSSTLSGDNDIEFVFFFFIFFRFCSATHITIEANGEQTYIEKTNRQNFVYEFSYSVESRSSNGNRTNAIS